MQIRLLYASRAVGPQTSTVTASVLQQARAYNGLHGITGVLCQGQGLYLQVLEGPRAAVNELFMRIVTDRRHQQLQLLQLEEITQRRYPGWSMALVDLSDRDAMVQMGHPEFDPFSATGAFVTAMVTELVAAGRVIEMPANP
jgi:Sensors of blue-light using FAD